MRLSTILPASFLCFLSLAGCGSSEPKPSNANEYANSGQYSQQGQYGQQTQVGQQSQVPQTGQYQQASQYPQTGQVGQQTTPTQATQAGGFPSIPGLPALGQPASTGGSSATPIAFASALTPAIQMLASSEAPGMSPDGQAFAGQFQEGQTLEQSFNVQAGKCYTILAASAGAIQQLDVQLVAQQSPLPAVVLAQASGGTSATVGGKSSGCFRNPLPVGGPGTVILKATHGSGIAGAQIFVK